MTSDLWALVVALLLASVQLGIASVLTLGQAGGAWVLSPRDTPHEVTGMSGRFVRAHRNLLEIFPQFVAALFVVHAAGAVGLLAAVGAWAFVAARVLYVPAYVFGPPGVRPLFWQVGVGGHSDNSGGPILVTPQRRRLPSMIGRASAGDASGRTGLIPATR